MSLSPYSRPCSSRPAPSSLPTIMPAAAPMPLHKQHIKSRTTEAMEFAAAASASRCPIIAV